MKFINALVVKLVDTKDLNHVHLIVGKYYHSLKVLYFNVYFKSNDHKRMLNES